MSKLSEELSIVPGSVLFWAGVVYAALIGFILWIGRVGGSPFGALEFALVTVGLMVVTVYALVVGYIYADAKRRGMRYVMWTLLAVFIPNAIGIILYFLLRTPIPRPCSACGAPNQPGFAFCPKCGAGLNPVCPACRKGVEREWTSCAWCGQPLTGAPSSFAGTKEP